MNIILMLIGVIVVYYIIVILYRKNWSKGLLVSIEFERKHAVLGDTVNLVEVITNDKKLPLPVINLKFEIDKNIQFNNSDTNSSITDRTYRNDVFSLLGKQRITRRIPVECKKRGVYRICDAEIVFSGIFMNEINILKNDVSAQITVFPKMTNIHRIQDMSNTVIGDIERKKYLLEDRFVFKGIRQYQNYDSQKSVNWNATARTGMLMVNEYNETMSKNVCILLNLQSDGALTYETVLEESISIAAGFACDLASKGVNVRIITNGCDIDSKSYDNVKYGTGMAHLNTLNTFLARIDLSCEMMDFSEVIEKELIQNKFSDNNYIDNGCPAYIVISSDRRKKLIDNIKRITKEQDNLFWIVPYLPGMDYGLDNSEIRLIGWEIR